MGMADRSVVVRGVVLAVAGRALASGMNTRMGRAIGVVTASLLLSVGTAAVAQVPGIPGLGGVAVDLKRKDAVRHSQARLIVEHAGVRAGGTVMLGIHMTIEPGWHTYWNGRSDSGTPLTADFELPAGWALGAPDEWQWPTPARHVGEGDILDHIYEEAVTILVPLKAPEGAKVGETVRIKGKAEWLVCKEACVFEDGTLEASVAVVGEKDEPKPTADAALIAAARARVPVTGKGENVKAVWAGDVVTITVEKDAKDVGGAPRVEFYPAADCIGLVEPVYRTSASGASLRLKVDLSDTERRDLRGVLAVLRPVVTTVGEAGGIGGAVGAARTGGGKASMRLERSILLHVRRESGVKGEQSPAGGVDGPKQEGPSAGGRK